MSSTTDGNDPTRISAPPSDDLAAALDAFAAKLNEALEQQKLAHDKEMQSIRKTMTDLEKKLKKEIENKNALINQQRLRLSQFETENKKVRAQLKANEDRIKNLTSPLKKADNSLDECKERESDRLEKLEKKIAVERDAATKEAQQLRERVNNKISKLQVGLLATNVAIAAFGATAVELVCIAAAGKPFLAILGVTLISNTVGAAILSGLAVAAGILLVGYCLHPVVKFVKSRMVQQIVDQAQITEAPCQAAPMTKDPPSVTAIQSTTFN